MDMTNIMYELVNTKTSLTIADRTIETLQKQNRRLNRRCLRQSLMIAGLTWLTVTACRMLSENDAIMPSITSSSPTANPRLPSGLKLRSGSFRTSWRQANRPSTATPAASTASDGSGSRNTSLSP